MIKYSKVNREKLDWLLNQPVDVQLTCTSTRTYANW